MNTELREAVVALLKIEFALINFNYDSLTDKQKELLTKDQFNKLVVLMHK